jgi:hypothetical protein
MKLASIGNDESSSYFRNYRHGVLYFLIIAVALTMSSTLLLFGVSSRPDMKITSSQASTIVVPSVYGSSDARSEFQADLVSSNTLPAGHIQEQPPSSSSPPAPPPPSSGSIDPDSSVQSGSSGGTENVQYSLVFAECVIVLILIGAVLAILADSNLI